MTEPVLVVVSGAPGTGKTTMAQRVSDSLRIPYFGKDLAKEALFDSLGVGDREWSRKLGRASTALLFRIIEAHLRQGQSVVAESNVYRELDKPSFNRLAAVCQFRVVEIHCEVSREVLHERLRQRDRSADRHSGHQTSGLVHEIDRFLDEGAYGPLALGGPVVRIDTGDLGQSGYDEVVSAVRGAIGT